MTNKPTLFVGSSTEKRDIAYAVQANLDDCAEVTVWNQGIFKLNKSNLESLLIALDRFDFAIFIYSRDDLGIIRDEKVPIVRDNVLFELGLFIGRIGRDRSFIITPKDDNELHVATDLTGLTHATYDSKRTDNEAALGPACNKIQKVIREIGPLPRQSPIREINLIQKDDFSYILIKRLGDPEIAKIRIIAYTAEVDSGLLNQFHIKSPKTIEVYKRSILADLAEEQDYNIEKIVEGSNVKIWNKKEKSIEVSELLEKHVPPGSTITQYFYDQPPSIRAYIFNANEAITAYYEVLTDPNQGPDSAYRGISDSKALHITNNSPLGIHILNELENYIAGLKKFSRSWTDEREILFHHGKWKWSGKRPCINPQVVFLDMDGVLYNSIPMYVKAWQDAFSKENINFPELRAYLEEGRNGKETIKIYLKEIDYPDISYEVIDRIYGNMINALSSLGLPPPMKGASDLLDMIIKSKLDLFVVTGSVIPGHIQRLPEVFPGLIKENNIITGQNTLSGKPSPEPYLYACNRAKINPHESISIENGPLGIESANSAGTFCLGVNTGKLQNSDLENAGARAVFKTCEDIAKKWEWILNILN